MGRRSARLAGTALCPDLGGDQHHVWPLRSGRLRSAVVSGGLLAAVPGRRPAGVAERDRRDRPRRGHGRQYGPANNRARVPRGLRRVRGRQSRLSDREAIRAVRRAQVLCQRTGRPQPRLGRADPAALRRPADLGLPVHSRRPHRRDADLRHSRLPPPQLRPGHRLLGGHLGQLCILARPPRREGVRGQAVGGLRARLRCGHRRERPDRGRAPSPRALPGRAPGARGAGRAGRAGLGRAAADPAGTAPVQTEPDQTAAMAAGPRAGDRPATRLR